MNIIKIAIIAFSYITLFNNLNNSELFFKGLTLFTAGLLYDYTSIVRTKFAHRPTFHKVIGWIGIIISSVVFIIGFVGALKGADFSVAKEAASWVIKSPANFVPFPFNINIYLISTPILILYVLAFIEGFTRCNRCEYKVNSEKK